MRAGRKTRGFVAVTFAAVTAAASITVSIAATGTGPLAGGVAGKPSASGSTSGSVSASATAASVELTLLHGTKTLPSSIPPAFASVLNTPPWTAYTHYVVLSTKSLSLATNNVVKEALPSGHTVEITLLAGGPSPKMELVLKDSKGAQVAKGTYTQPKGVPLLPWQVPYKNGGLVVAVRP